MTMKNTTTLGLPAIPPLPPATGSETFLDEYVRLDKTIRDCEHALLIAERLKVRGRPLAESEIEPVRRKLQETLIERDFLDEWINRRGKSPNRYSTADCGISKVAWGSCIWSFRACQ